GRGHSGLDVFGLSGASRLEGGPSRRPGHLRLWAPRPLWDLSQEARKRDNRRPMPRIPSEICRSPGPPTPLEVPCLSRRTQRRPMLGFVRHRHGTGVPPGGPLAPRAPDRRRSPLMAAPQNRDTARPAAPRDRCCAVVTAGIEPGPLVDALRRVPSARVGDVCVFPAAGAGEPEADFLIVAANDSSRFFGLEDHIGRWSGRRTRVLLAVPESKCAMLGDLPCRA